jgi:hydrogenase maturation protease
MKPCVLVIGYGNELRRDDGVGPRVARAAAAWGLPGLKALDLPLLAPELAEEMAAYDRVIFVDAAVTGEGLQVRTLTPAVAGDAETGHLSNPRVLLALAEALHGHCPTAWLITAPVADLGHGEGLSPTAEQGAAEALRQLALLLRNQAGWCDRLACRGQDGPCPWEPAPFPLPALAPKGPAAPESEA